MKIKYLTGPSALSVASALALQGFTLLSFFLLARLLPVAQMGAWALWLTLASIADMTRQGLVQNGLARFTASQSADTGQWLTAGLALNALSALVLGGLLSAGGWVTGAIAGMPELKAISMVAVPVFLLQGMGRFAEAVQVARRDFRGILLANLANGGTQFVLVLYCFFKKTPPDLLQLLFFQTLGVLAGLAVSLLFFKKHFRFGAFDPAKLTALYRFGRYVGGTNFFSLLFQRLDTLLIGTFLTPAAVAIYNMATRLNGLLDLPLNSLSLAQFPLVAKSHAEGQSIHEVTRQSLRKLLMVQAPLSLALVALAPQAVRLLGGTSYLEAAPLLQILAVAGLAKPWGRSFGMTLDAIGRSDLNFRMLMFSFAVNLALNLVLVPAYGMTGAALATGLGTFITILAGQILLKRLNRQQEALLLSA